VHTESRLPLLGLSFCDFVMAQVAARLATTDPGAIVLTILLGTPDGTDAQKQPAPKCRKGR